MFMEAVFGTVMVVSSGAAVVAGALVARARTRAVEALAATLPEPASAEPSPGPFRTPAAMPVSPGDGRARRRKKLYKHDYDLMIGRTFFR